MRLRTNWSTRSESPFFQPRFQAMTFFLFVAYIYCKSPAFRPLKAGSLRARDKVFLFVLWVIGGLPSAIYLGLALRRAE